MAGLLFAATPAAAEPFGLHAFDVTFTGPGGEAVTQAGAHPYAMTTSFAFDTRSRAGGGVNVADQSKDVEISQIPGLVGSPEAVPRCSSADFLTAQRNNEGVNMPNCPDATAIGMAKVRTVVAGIPVQPFWSPVYDLVTSPGYALKLGWWTGGVPITVEAGVAESPPYNAVVHTRNISQVLEVEAGEVILWGVPATSSHDALRGNCGGGAGEEPTSFGKCPAGIAEEPFLTLPRACRGPLLTDYAIDSWVNPGARLPNGEPDLADSAWVTGSAETHDSSEPPAPQGMTGCDSLGFSPEITAKPTSRAAESSSGLDFSLDVTHNEGLTNPAGYADADVEKAVVTLPEGMTANPSSANGLETCSEAQFEAESPWSAPGEGPTYTPPGAGCPDASKLGTIEVETPLIGETLKGSLYLAKPYENPEHTLLALYMAIRSARYGVIFKVPMKVEPDPVTGQLVTTAEDLPQWPFSHFRLHFREGARSPLVTPPTCGTHTVKALLYPSSGARALETTSSFEIVTGPNGGACPSGAEPFNPGFEAGSLNNAAGRYSEFDMRLTRSDGDQDLTKFSAKLPPGMIGRLAGTSQCPDAAIAQARSRTGIHGGEEERSNPSCPADSQIGTVEAGAGVGSILTYVPGNLYLAGPYKGAPLSVVAIVPALAGPFDAGTVVTQEALRIDTRTAEVEADGSSSDPIPHILQGIPLKVRDIRVYVSKPDFTLNPTSCEESATEATLWSGGQNAFSALDDTAHSLSARFQAADCANLGFKPRLGLKLRGGTRRGAFPALHLVYRPHKGDANLARLALRFPRSEFIEQGHFRTICTRVQFAAGEGFGSQCPKGSVYGHVKIWTPLLDQPLLGPVYLRSSNHNLPDVVLALHGPPSLAVKVEVPTRIDSVKGGLRAIASATPDVPVSAAVIDMQGGKKGLFVNSTNICRGTHRARVAYRAHNGRRLVVKPPLRAVSCRKAKRKNHKRHARRARAARRSSAR